MCCRLPGPGEDEPGFECHGMGSSTYLLCGGIYGAGSVGNWYIDHWNIAGVYKPDSL